MATTSDSPPHPPETTAGKLWHIAASGIRQGVIGAATGLIGGLVIGGIATALLPKTKDTMSLFNDAITKSLNRFAQSETFKTFIRCISHSGSNIARTAGYFFSLLPGTLNTAIKHPEAQQCLAAHIDSAQQVAKYAVPAAGAIIGAATGMVGGTITGTIGDAYTILTEQNSGGKHVQRIMQERAGEQNLSSAIS